MFDSNKGHQFNMDGKRVFRTAKSQNRQQRMTSMRQKEGKKHKNKPGKARGKYLTRENKPKSTNRVKMRVLATGAIRKQPNFNAGD